MRLSGEFQNFSKIETNGSVGNFSNGGGPFKFLIYSAFQDSGGSKRTDDKIWGNLGKFGEIWGNLGKFGEICEGVVFVTD